jgi:hypothetical protein
MTDLSGLSIRFSELEAQLDAVEATKKFVRSDLLEGHYIDNDQFLSWRVKARNLLSQACGRESEHYKDFEKYEKALYVGDTNYGMMKRLKAIFLAAKEDFERGHELRLLSEAENDMNFFQCNEKITIERQDGSRHENVAAMVSDKMILIPDVNIPIEPNDAILRQIPSGLVERFIVTEHGYHSGMSGPGITGIQPHYRVRYRREGKESTDNSSNAVVHHTYDLNQLTNELVQLRTALVDRAQTTEHYVAIGAVASAEAAAKAGEQSKVDQALSSLGAAGRWVFDTAKEIGVQVATGALKAKLGL